MCFRFCFGSGSGQDVDRSTTPTHTHRTEGQADHRYYSGADHKSGRPPQAYHHVPAADEEEAMRSTGAGAWRKGHDGDDAQDTLKHAAAWNGKIGDGTGGYTYTDRLHDAAAAHHKEYAAMDYHGHPTTNTTSHARN